jgi:hypothetical protein
MSMSVHKYKGSQDCLLNQAVRHHFLDRYDTRNHPFLPYITGYTSKVAYACLYNLLRRLLEQSKSARQFDLTPEQICQEADGQTILQTSLDTSFILITSS